MQNAKATQNIHLANRLENIFHSFSLFLLTIFPLVFVDIFPTPLFSQRRLREIGWMENLWHWVTCDFIDEDDDD